MAAPLFMFGLERSGTTLLSMMVGAHPEIAVPLTVTGLWYHYDRQLAHYGQLATRHDLERLVDDLLVEERIRLWDVQLSRSELLDGLKLGSFAAVIERFHQLYARQKNKPLWGNLDIATLDHMDVANRWFPQARFLHIIRDGRDVALSHETMPYGASNTLEAAEKWVHRLQVNLKMGAILGAERYRVIRYEDLILETEATLREICAFIDVAYSPAMLEYAQMVEEKVPKDRRWLWPVLDQPPDKSKVYGWKTKMSMTKRVVFEGVANEFLRELGYEAFARVPRRGAAYAYELWCFLGRGGRYRRLAAKVGLRRASKLERSWRSHSAIQQDAFGSLVRSGAYNADFEHAPHMQAFFRECIAYARSRVGLGDSPGERLSILDCGCGPGAWLDFIYRMELQDNPAQIRYYGFDITPEMIEVARRRLDRRVPPEHLRQGDILDEASYAFDQAGPRYQIIYAFDVVQQLPRKLQFAACLAMLRHLAPNGCALIFDHDRHSPYGRTMGFKKFVTRYLHIELVPRYYCNARYPALARFAKQIEASGPFTSAIKIAPDGKKRALIVQALAGGRVNGS